MDRVINGTYKLLFADQDPLQGPLDNEFPGKRNRRAGGTLVQNKLNETL